LARAWGGKKINAAYYIHLMKLNLEDCNSAILLPILFISKICTSPPLFASLSTPILQKIISGAHLFASLSTPVLQKVISSSAIPNHATLNHGI
jgi:hypothetical protein